MGDIDETGGGAPCLLGEMEQVALEVGRWRKAERVRLITARQALPVAARAAADVWLGDALDARVGSVAGRVIGIYWPIKGEPDLRAWAARCRDAGARIALPVVVAKGAPLVFRVWQAGAALERGVWNIPIPGPEAEEVVPDVVISPLVGLGDEVYRLGYGGGFYDRTLARIMALGAKPVVIGVGYAFQRIATIFPQPHDVPMGEALLAEI